MTISEDLYFLKEIDFSDHLDNNQVEIIKGVRKTKVKEFEDTN